MENQKQVSTAPASNLVTARHNLVKGAAKTGDLIKGYAVAMCAAFNQVDSSGTIVTPWYELKGKPAAGIKLERDAFSAEMIEQGFNEATVRVYWQRVKEESGRPKTENRVSGSKSTDERTLDDLKTLINRIFKAEENGEECNASEHKGTLIEIFGALGGDIDNLG
jgi:hypothetical protein